MDLASAFIVPAPCAGAWQPARHAHPVAPSAKRAASFDGSRSSLCLALLAARVVKSSRAYFSGNRLSPAELAERTERKREMETNRFFANQRSLLKVGGRRPLSDAQWARDEKLLFGSSHVVAGINFSKYDDIKVVAEGGTGKEKPIASFQEACDRYQLPDELTENLTRCSYSTPTPVQKYSIPAVLEGSDVMVTAQTGSGKTAAFLVPIVTAALKAGPKVLKEEGPVCPTSVVLAPTRELCQQIAQEAKRLTFRSSARVTAIFGGQDAAMQLNSIAAGIEIVVAAPGRLDDFLQRGVISMEEVKFLVVDEADRMLDMGFEPQLRNIIENYGMPDPGEGGRQTMMFSATFPQEMQDMALDFLDPAYYGISVGQVGHAATDVEQVFEEVPWAEKHTRLFDLLQEVTKEDGRPAKTIVFANTKAVVDDITFRLEEQDIRASSMHGDTSQNNRNRALADLKSGRIDVLVATDLAARGLDVPGVDHIVNFDLPQDGDSYVHRIGRTGRIGNKGRATSFVGNRESSLRSIVKAMMDAKKDDPDASDVPDWLEEMAAQPMGGRGRARR